MRMKPAPIVEAICSQTNGWVIEVSTKYYWSELELRMSTMFCQTMMPKFM